MNPTPDRTLDDPQQTIADLQRANAELQRQLEEARAERDEALEQQTATTEVLQVINSSPGDLAPVFDAMLEKATRLCEAARGQLAICDGEFSRIVAAHGESAFVRELLAQGPRPAAWGVTWPRIVAGERLVHMPDIADTDLYRSGNESARRLVETGGARSLLTVSLRKDDVLLGALTIYRQEVNPFSDKQIALLESFAAQAVIAMENARLITETREALEQQTATAEVLQVINSSPGDLAPVFEAILSKAHDLCGAELGVLLTYDGDCFRPVAAHGASTRFMEATRQGFSPGLDNPFARVLQGERFVQIADVAELAAQGIDDPELRIAMEIGIRTFLVVPLRRDDVLLGAITANRREVRPFSDKQITLLQNFAAQAVIAMENARLINETREALEQQTATAEVLQVINSSPGDLPPVFNAMLEKATALCDAAFGIILTWDGDSFHRVAFRGVPDDLMEALSQPMIPVPGSIADRVVQGEQVISVSNLLEEDSYRIGAAGARALADIGGARSFTLVTLRNDNKLLGLISVYRQAIQPFADTQVTLLKNFAAQAVIAMENARLITETREALDQQTATAEVLQVINSSPGDLAPVFDAILEQAHALCGAESGALFVFDGETFHAASVHGFHEDLAALLRQARTISEAPGLAPLVAGARVVHFDLAQVDDPVGRAVAQRGGVRTNLLLPLRKDGALLGVISCNRLEVRPFTDKQIALLENFAAQAVIAMENARLINETREALEQQTATAEVLQVINSSPGDLAPVFDAILEKALHLCHASYGGSQTFDGEFFRMAAYRGDQRLQDMLAQMGPFRPGRGSTMDRLLRGESVVQVLDVSADEQFKGDGPIRRHLVEIAGARTLLSIALRKDERLVGALHVYRQEVRPFTEKQIALLQSFAAQAVIAMENARLLGELRQRTEEVGELNRDLEARVAEQVDELSRVGRLKRFLAPQLAEMIVSQGDEKILESHRREIVVVFCDLRGYTAFTETAEPEEVLDFLREYHGALGPLVSQFEGTLDQFSGDGIMVFFNDPVPCADPAQRAINMAVAMRSAANTLIADWRERGRDLGFGAGIAQGYATLGQIGFSERSGYTAIGTVCNVAARLCAEAKDGQILLGQRVNVALKGSVVTEQLGPLALKGLTQPVVAYNVPLATIQPALRVIEGGSPEIV